MHRRRVADVVIEFMLLPAQNTVESILGGLADVVTSGDGCLSKAQRPQRLDNET